MQFTIFMHIIQYSIIHIHTYIYKHKYSNKEIIHYLKFGSVMTAIIRYGWQSHLHPFQYLYSTYSIQHYIIVESLTLILYHHLYVEKHSYSLDYVRVRIQLENVFIYNLHCFRKIALV